MHEYKGYKKTLSMFTVHGTLLLCPILWDCIIVYEHIKDKNKALTAKQCY